MQWENLTVPDFVAAVKQTAGVAILPVGVLEPHGAHLPLGQDMFHAHALACQAAEREPAVVFPAYPWGINHEAMHLPGAVALRRELVLALLDNVCDEIARNGFKKIVLLSGHGGNRFVLPLFVQTFVEQPRDYAVYFARLPFMPQAERVLETKEFGHACEGETSMAMHLFPHLVKMRDVPPPFTNAGRSRALQDAGAYAPTDWYGMYPTMYVGDAHPSTAAKGKTMCDAFVERLVSLLRAVKTDQVTAGLLEEFSRGQAQPRSAY